MKLQVFLFYSIIRLQSTGDSKNQVHMEGYQVSNQCQALVQDSCLIPTKDAPELAYVRQSSQQTYIPDVYYKVSELFYILISNGGWQVVCARWACITAFLKFFSQLLISSIRLGR